MRRVALGLAAVLALCGACKGTPVFIDNGVPPGIDRSQARTVEGDAWGYQLLLFLPLGVNTRHARAWQELLDKAGDAYVTNVQLKEGWRWGVIGTFYHSTFRATAYPRRSTSAAAGADGGAEAGATSGDAARAASGAGRR
jgi:hypothetical protein